MRTTTAFHECAENVQTEACSYWAAKEPLVEDSLLAGTSADAWLDMTVRYQPNTNRYEVRAVLQTPAATLTVDEADRDIRTALDRVTEALEQAVRESHPATPAWQPDADIVDATSADSFPASDAPSWTPVCLVGPPPSKEEG
jgi:hypothetical protein